MMMIIQLRRPQSTALRAALVAYGVVTGDHESGGNLYDQLSAIDYVQGNTHDVSLSDTQRALIAKLPHYAAQVSASCAKTVNVIVKKVTK